MSRRPIVYLAGPITGLTYEGSVEWRDWFAQSLGQNGIAASSPMRCKEALRTVGVLEATCGQHPGHNARTVMTRDRFDATHCDVLLANLLGAERVSIGTCMELAWADLARIPTVVIMEPDGTNPHEHAMITEAIGFRVADLDSALRTVVEILEPYA